jgi:Niemann-Pick C1 protein
MKYKVVYLSERSVPDELAEETSQNVWVVIISYIMMFCYIALALGQFPSLVYSSFLLGLGGILIVAAAMIGSLGIVSYANIGLTMISAEVIPFLILAIGVDNMFIITHTLERTTGASSLPDLMGRTLESVGPSITAAAICETLAFLVGALTKMPAL